MAKKEQYPKRMTEKTYAAFDEIAKFAEENPVLAQVIHRAVIANILKKK